MAESEARIAERRRISFVWLVPLVALALGIWMVIHTLRSRGPEITIGFASGEGIEAGKTRIKARAVEIGLVEEVALAEDLESVVVTARLDREAEPLLREDTELWVVRPRVGLGGVSGLGTLLSGGYIRLAPGTGERGRRAFVGLDVPPVTPVGSPGLHLRLVSESTGSLGPGDPVVYKGYPVGRIDSAELDVESDTMHYGAFIEAPFDDLVTDATRFWNASGVAASLSAEGIRVSTGSLETLLAGGAAFGLPEGGTPGKAVESGAVFDLYADYAQVNERPYRHGVEYVLQFTRSVRGLEPGAPVEYRGIPVGRVERVLLAEAARQGFSGEGRAIPVLIRLEPGRLELPDTEEGAAALARTVETAVGNGLRGSLATGSLLTGSLYVDFDVHPDAPPVATETLGRFAGYPVLPSTSGGLEQIELQVSALLAKLDALPLDRVLVRVDRLLSDLNAVVASEELRALPASLDATLAELRRTLDSLSTDSAVQERLIRTMGEMDRTLASLRGVLEVLEEQPNALLFNRAQAEDPEPPAGMR